MFAFISPCPRRTPQRPPTSPSPSRTDGSSAWKCGPATCPPSRKCSPACPSATGGASPNDVTLLYLMEAMQAYKAGCVLSATVMIGVATEHEFGLLLETIEGNGHAAKLYAKALQQKQMARRLTEFNKVLEEETKKFEPELRENLNIDLMTGVANAIRNFRNESGHPTGQIISREQCFVLLQVVIPCLKKIEALRHHYMLPTPPVTP